MHNTTFRDFIATMEDVARDIVRASRRAVAAIVAMPWPAMLACCIGLALLVTILPVALFLFILFMVVKVVAGAFLVDRRRDLREQAADPYGKQ
jgi:membrane protein implicated in regulation of membrane protease activity